MKPEIAFEKEDISSNPVIDRKTLWNLETTLVELNLAIKSSVGLTNADAQKCVGLLEDLQSMKFNWTQNIDRFNDYLPIYRTKNDKANAEEKPKLRWNDQTVKEIHWQYEKLEHGSGQGTDI